LARRILSLPHYIEGVDIGNIDTVDIFLQAMGSMLTKATFNA